MLDPSIKGIPTGKSCDIEEELNWSVDWPRASQDRWQRFID